MSKPIQLPKETILALLKGASKFIVPVAEKIQIQNEEDGRFSAVIENSSTMNLDSVGNFLNEDLFKSYLIQTHTPIQKGDEFFIQEDFTEDEILLGGTEILYKNDFLPRDFENSAIGYGLTTDKMKERILERCEWIDAAQMQEHQSRFKDKVILNVEVKRLHDLYLDDILDLIAESNTEDLNIDNFDAWIDAQFNSKYNENLNVFVFTIQENKLGLIK